MMMKKFFALASMSAVAGVIAAGAMVGCSSSDSNTTADNDAGQTPDAAKTDGGKKSDGGGVDAAEPAPPAEEKTVGKICSTDSDCEVPDTANDNICSKGIFNKEGGDDLFATPVCIQTSCTPLGQNDTDISHIFCDGDETGLCLPAGGGNGICFAACQFDNTGIVAKCQGNNKCAPGYLLAKTDKSAISVGFCTGACTKDSDCVGTAGQKCQTETGSCVAEKHKVTTYTGKLGDACSDTAGAGSTVCNCNTSSASANPLKGVCGNACVTGAAGNAMCDGLKAGWKCSALLPAKNKDGSDYFTKQPDELSGGCHLPCPNGDSDCATLSTNSTNEFTCQEFADGKFCDFK